MSLVVVVLLLLALLVCQPGTGLRLLLTVMAWLLLPLLVCQPGMGLCMLLAVTVLMLLLVCQPGMGFYVLLAVIVPLLLPSCGGHAVQIVPLAVSGRQPVPGSDVHSRRKVLQDVHEELQGGELHCHQWLNGGSQGP